jgi:hypothetical protein
MAPFKTFLSRLLAPLTGKSSDEVTRNISTPTGDITLKTKSLDPVPQQIVPVDALELARIQALDDAAPNFLAAFKPGAQPSLKSYDEAFAAWQRDPGLRFTEDAVVGHLGACLGNRLAADFDMEWVVVSDEYGTDLAVRSRRYDLLSFPFSSVAKRIENRQFDFMEGVYYAVQDTIARGPRER